MGVVDVFLTNSDCKDDIPSNMCPVDLVVGHTDCGAETQMRLIVKQLYKCSVSLDDTSHVVPNFLSPGSLSPPAEPLASVTARSFPIQRTRPNDLLFESA